MSAELAPHDWITRRAAGSLSHLFETALMAQIRQYLQPMNRFLKEDRGIEGKCRLTLIPPQEIDKADASLLITTPVEVGGKKAIFSRIGNRQLIVRVEHVVLRYQHIWSGTHYAFRLVGGTKGETQGQVGEFFDMDEVVRDTMERLFLSA